MDRFSFQESFARFARLQSQFDAFLDLQLFPDFFQIISAPGQVSTARFLLFVLSELLKITIEFTNTAL